MSRTRELAGGGKAVEVEPERLARFLGRFADQHGGAVRTRLTPERVDVDAADGASAGIAVPFGPWQPDQHTCDGLRIEPLQRHLLASRTFGLVLVRLGGFSTGIARDGAVITSRTGRRPVHGRSAAGGWSQQRFARRRAVQARVALQAAADAVAEVVATRVAELDAVVLGGDQAALQELRGDRRLAELWPLAGLRVLDVPEPRRGVLDEAARRALCVEVELRAASWGGHDA